MQLLHNLLILWIICPSLYLLFKYSCHAFNCDVCPLLINNVCLRVSWMHCLYKYLSQWHDKSIEPLKAPTEAGPRFDNYQPNFLWWSMWVNALRQVMVALQTLLFSRKWNPFCLWRSFFYMVMFPYAWLWLALCFFFFQAISLLLTLVLCRKLSSTLSNTSTTFDGMGPKA